MSSETGPELPVTFAAFVVSLAQSALMHLGEVNNPGTGKPQPDLLLARNTIDLLGMLEQKTKGNLDEEETKLLETILFDLRSKFVAKAP